MLPPAITQRRLTVSWCCSLETPYMLRSRLVIRYTVISVTLTATCCMKLYREHWTCVVMKDCSIKVCSCRSQTMIELRVYCSDLRSVTIHLHNHGPTSETLKHGHMRCNDFWIESCFRVHSSKISKQVSRCVANALFHVYVCVGDYTLPFSRGKYHRIRDQFLLIKVWWLILDELGILNKISRGTPHKSLANSARGQNPGWSPQKQKISYLHLYNKYWCVLGV